METIEYRTTDKSRWPVGPWMTEPDKKQWPDPVTGYPCLIVRNTWSGILCGYVAVPEGHPLYGRRRGSVDLYCHGGVTFAGACDPEADEATGICHVAPGEDKAWWFGFDCGHAPRDLSPGFTALVQTHFPENQEIHSLFRGVYRDLAYVESSVRALALQLKALA